MISCWTSCWMLNLSMSTYHVANAASTKHLTRLSNYHPFFLLLCVHGVSCDKTLNILADATTSTSKIIEMVMKWNATIFIFFWVELMLNTGNSQCQVHSCMITQTACVTKTSMATAAFITCLLRVNLKDCVLAVFVLMELIDMGDILSIGQQIESVTMLLW